ncbi:MULTISPECIES: quinolinate synthase NadA [Empedobacter]|uniref:Quinolinate synthase n=1 Tax=Empedobacter falsenii TaxID=343874 RepID=A0A7H9DWM9_9FLAO|nr:MULTISPECIES: quinolinate synthase NadA [Empedobacter]HAR74492.1 quinolinate synthase NadA [Flavobacteriaceae bacterium]MBY0067599.1 quinolinate synthase NadA [Empedobacter falsenii]MDH0658907.1 quinolinate synthase NadA [Empedobacter sp. GD03865]MDH0673172.1 quinolinate synthase NadA [Empedobacter sp. GD03861]MDH1603636.1 quinolinate synthase NadA [Empedobacter sp. GD03739]
MNTLEQAIEKLDYKGYLDVEIPKGTDLIAEINKLRKEKNAVILAHYYQSGEIQDLADYLGDSLQLARAAAKTEADMIVFCGVHFMAEAAKILNPSKKVVLPDTKAGCSLADSCSAEGLRGLREQHPNAIVVSYINCDAGVKAESDIIVTSSNAEAIINSLPEDQEIIFAPDRNLGRYLNQVCNRKMILWDGACIVHEAFSLERIAQQMADHPNAKLIAHPEAQEDLLKFAHFIGSTSRLLDYVVENDAQEFIVATEEGILHEMQKLAPNKTLIPALVQDESCNCSECFYMKLSTLEKLYLCMKYELPEIQIEEELRVKALAAINRMLDLSEKIK